MFHTNIPLLKSIISSRGKTFEGLAKDLGIDRSTLQRRIKYGRLLVCDIQRLAEILCLSNAEFCEIFLAH